MAEPDGEQLVDPLVDATETETDDEGAGQGEGPRGREGEQRRAYRHHRDRDRDGRLDKTLVADLMNIANPRHVGEFGDTFTFPFQTIEDVVILDDRTLAVVNDNNFPFSAGRTAGQPNNNEFIVIKLDHGLDADGRIMRRF